MSHCSTLPSGPLREAALPSTPHPSSVCSPRAPFPVSPKLAMMKREDFAGLCCFKSGVIKVKDPQAAGDFQGQQVVESAVPAFFSSHGRGGPLLPTTHRRKDLTEGLRNGNRRFIRT